MNGHRLVPVEAAALHLDHVIVVDGQPREICRLAQDRSALSYYLPGADDMVRELPLQPGDLVPCLRRADWIAQGGPS